jgi:hypothetical protein
MKIVKYLNFSLKILLMGLLLHYVMNQDLPQYLNKGMSYRLALYPFGAFIGYFVYFIVRITRRRKLAYPHFIDLLATFCITFDMLGNTLDLYNGIVWWDDFMHFFNTIPWVLIVGIALRSRTRLKRLNVAALTLGFGAISHTLWELGEYATFVPNNPLEGPSAYRDTMGDLALSLGGSFIGAILIATVLWRVAKQK